tara:strand:+ start:1959 stop:2159 length:201 start_codon:yes stop_codon:yes gene_type:complete
VQKVLLVDGRCGDAHEKPAGSKLLVVLGVAARRRRRDAPREVLLAAQCGLAERGGGQRGGRRERRS